MDLYFVHAETNLEKEMDAKGVHCNRLTLTSQGSLAGIAGYLPVGCLATCQ